MQEIKNLSQLKKAIEAKRPFVIVKHYVKPQFEGQRRVPNKIMTNGFYSVVEGEPEHPVSTMNDGWGSAFWYGKASDWKFEDGLCKCTERSKPIWEIQFV